MNHQRQNRNKYTKRILLYHQCTSCLKAVKGQRGMTQHRKSCIARYNNNAVIPISFTSVPNVCNGNLQTLENNNGSIPNSSHAHVTITQQPIGTTLNNGHTVPDGKYEQESIKFV